MEQNYFNDIEEYVKQINYKFSKANISFNLFPESFYNAVIKYIKKECPNYNDNPKIEKFNIIFNADGKVYFEFLANNNHTKVVVINNNTHYENLPPAKIVKSQDFFNEVLKQEIENYYNIITSIKRDFVKRYIKSFDKNCLIQELDNSMKTVKEYINYLLVESKKSIKNIYFKESDIPTGDHKSNVATGTTLDRKYDEIPFEEREKVLDDYPSEYEFNANAKNTKSTYKIKVFKIPSEKFRIIMEPKQANRYTKIVYLDRQKLDEKEAEDISINVLGMNRSELSNSTNISRHSHTELEKYQALLDYIIKEKSDKINPSTKYRIDEITGVKKGK